MELCLKIMLKSVRYGNFRLYYKCEDPEITHLSFADDLIAFMAGSLGQLVASMTILKSLRITRGYK